jgi:hypothetical protein
MYPATIGHSLPSNKSAKRCTAGCRHDQETLPGLAALGADFEVRQRRAGRALGEPQIVRPKPRDALFCSSRRPFHPADQTRAISAQLSSGNQGRPATSAVAQVLTSRLLLPTMQKQDCLQFIQETILF